MYPHEKPGYVDACRAAGVCPSVLIIGQKPVYCDVPAHGHTGRDPVHRGTRYGMGEWDNEYWYNEGCAPLEGGS